MTNHDEQTAAQTSLCANHNQNLVKDICKPEENLVTSLSPNLQNRRKKQIARHCVPFSAQAQKTKRVVSGDPLPNSRPAQTCNAVQTCWIEHSLNFKQLRLGLLWLHWQLLWAGNWKAGSKLKTERGVRPSSISVAVAHMQLQQTKQENILHPQAPSWKRRLRSCCKLQDRLCLQGQNTGRQQRSTTFTRRVRWQSPTVLSEEFARRNKRRTSVTDRGVKKYGSEQQMRNAPPHTKVRF